MRNGSCVTTIRSPYHRNRIEGHVGLADDYAVVVLRQAERVVEVPDFGEGAGAAQRRNLCA